MKGTKRLAVTESAPDTNDSALRNKRVLGGALFDAHRAEPTQPQSNALPQLDASRAESSRQHVRALNTQFASWVQTQLKNHPDELWEDGVRDYIAHASNILEKFSDVVNWLKANAAKGHTAAASPTAEKKFMPELKGNESKLFQDKVPIAPPSTSTSFTTSWSSSMFSGNQTPGLPTSSPSSAVASNGQSSGLFSNSNNQSSGFFLNSQSSGLFSTSKNQSSGFFNSQSSGLFSNSQSTGAFSSNQSSGGLSSSQTSGGFAGSQSSGGLSSNQSSSFSFGIQSSGGLSSTQSPGIFSNNQGPFMFGGQNLNSIHTTQTTPDDAEEEDEIQQPGSPSVKKTEEQGVVVVHEVKCKLYLMSTDPAEKDPWKDKGTGQLSIKCKEGISKGTKESQPTIIVRNDVGKVLLNALLYPGIKTNPRKNSLVAIFHTLGDDGSNKAVARTFLIRLKTEDDQKKLATAIQEHAPAS
ncbi:hypothetical protein Tsubulata_031970 [Turnera subulata]|uniref:RanBD1 domain-containing protein n=1 Tax=Turnera subulata TaxID=218843 RepID=A0A9Q0GBI3_9ROSI|nr:hypothetical protein Tsubulata_031970 [Turnera subulata]